MAPLPAGSRRVDAADLPRQGVHLPGRYQNRWLELRAEGVRNILRPACHYCTSKSLTSMHRLSLRPPAGAICWRPPRYSCSEPAAFSIQADVMCEVAHLSCDAYNQIAADFPKLRARGRAAHRQVAASGTLATTGTASSHQLGQRPAWSQQPRSRGTARA